MGCARRATFCAAVVVTQAMLAPTLPVSARAPDRLDRFRELAAARLAPAQLVGQGVEEAVREIYALLDEEIVESLASGGVFASPAFLQDRLDAFSEVWGGAVIHLVPLDRIIVGAFHLGEHAVSSVRVYGRLGDEAALLTSLEREERPRLHPLPPEPGGNGQILIAWEGTPAGHDARPVRFDLAREHPLDGLRVSWTSADLFPAGLMSRAYTVRGREIRIRYEVRYPGWAPGCENQTEQEDVYRLATGPGTFVRVARREYHPWHREVHLSASRLYGALAARDRGTLASLVPDARLRARLPASLRPEPACATADGAPATVVSIAAVADPRLPWTLTFRRIGQGWRLTAADPIIP